MSGLHDKSIRHETKKSGSGRAEEKMRPRSLQSAQRLVVSSRASQSAVELCQSATSRGSDFVSLHENMFCSMDSKSLYPVCGDAADVGCFDLGSTSLRRGKAQAHANGSLKVRDAPRYLDVSLWD